MIQTSFRLLEQSRDLFAEFKYFIDSVQSIDSTFNAKKRNCEIKSIDFLPYKNYIDKALTEHKAKIIQQNSQFIQNIVEKVKNSFSEEKQGIEFEKEIIENLTDLNSRKWNLMSKEFNLETNTNLEFLKEIKEFLETFLPRKIVAKQLMEDLKLKNFSENLIDQVYPLNPKSRSFKTSNKSIQAVPRKKEIIEENFSGKKPKLEKITSKSIRKNKKIFKEISVQNFDDLRNKIKINFNIIQAARNTTNADSYICHMDSNYMYVSRKDMPSMIKIDIKSKKVKGMISDENYDQSIYLIKKQIVFGFINDYIYVNNIGEVPLLLDKAESTMVGKFFEIDQNDNLYYLSNHRKTLKKIQDPQAKPLNDQMITRYSSPNHDQIMDYVVSYDCLWVLMLTFNGYLAIFRDARLCSTLNLCLSKSEKAFNISVCPDFKYVGVSYWDSNEIQPKLKLSKIVYENEDTEISTRFTSKFMNHPFSPSRRNKVSGEKKSQILAMISSLNQIQDPGKEEDNFEKTAKLELIDFYKDFSSCSNISGICFGCYFSDYPIFVVFQAGSEKRVHYFAICEDKFRYLGSVKGIYSGVVKEVKMLDGDVFAVDSDLNVVKLELFH